jgi:hypothetical protein
MKLMTAVVMLTGTDETSVLSAGPQPMPEGFSRSINSATMKVTCRDATDSSAQAYAGSGDDGIISHKKKGCPKAQNPVLLPKVSNKFSKAGTTQCGEARPQKKTPFVPSSAHESVEAIEVKKGETETQWMFDEEVLQEERRKVQATNLTCLDASLSKAQVFAHLQRSGINLSIKLEVQPKHSAYPLVFSQLMYSESILLDRVQKNALLKFDSEHGNQSCTLKRALFHIS